MCDPPLVLLTALEAALVGALAVTVEGVVPAAFGVGAAGAALRVVEGDPVVALPPAGPVPLPVLAGADAAVEPVVGVAEPLALVVEVAAGGVALAVDACVAPFAPLPVALGAVPVDATGALLCAVVGVVLAAGTADGAVDEAVVGAALAVGALVPGVALVEPEDAPTGGF